MPTGLQPPDPILAGSPGGETLRIADSQANLCWAIFGQLLAGVIVALFPRVGILGAIIGIFTVCIAYSCYRALFGAVAAVFLSILTLFPCVGLVVLLIANSTATSRLRAAGYSGPKNLDSEMGYPKESGALHEKTVYLGLQDQDRS